MESLKTRQFSNRILNSCSTPLGLQPQEKHEERGKGGVTMPSVLSLLGTQASKHVHVPKPTEGNYV